MMKSILLAVPALAAALAAPGGASVAAPLYTFFNFDIPAATRTRPEAINNAGQVVGLGAFLRNPDGTLITLIGPGAASGITDARGINNLGQIVGTYTSDPIGRYSSGFLRDPATGAYTTLVDPNSRFSPSPAGLNDAGQIVGSYSQGGFLGAPDGSYTTLANPDAGGTTSITPFGINDHGQIVGSYIDGSFTQQGFLREADGTYTTLTEPDTPHHSIAGATLAFGINNIGQIVGYYVDSSGGAQGFLRDPNGTYTTLTDPDATGASFFSGTFAQGINDAGQIVGYYVNSSGTHGFIATPQATQTGVPEPTSLALLGVGWLGLCLGRRRPPVRTC